MGWNSSPGWQWDGRSHYTALRCQHERASTLAAQGPSPAQLEGISGSAAQRAGMRFEAKDLPSRSVCLCPQGKDKDRETPQRLGREGREETRAREKKAHLSVWQVLPSPTPPFLKSGLQADGSPG